MNIRVILCAAAMALGLGLGQRVSLAGDVLPLNLAQMTAKAGHIFEGTCTENRIERDPKTGLIQTISTFEVHDSLKGNGAKQIQVKQYGGLFPNGDGLLVAAMPRYAQGERMMLFLAPESEIGLTSPVGLTQGKFRVLPKAEGAGFRVVNSLQNQTLFRGIKADKLVRRDAKGRVLPEDMAVLRALKTGSKGADIADFKALVRRLIKTPPGSFEDNSRLNRVKKTGEVAR